MNMTRERRIQVSIAIFYFFLGLVSLFVFSPPVGLLPGIGALVVGALLLIGAIRDRRPIRQQRTTGSGTQAINEQSDGPDKRVILLRLAAVIPAFLLIPLVIIAMGEIFGITGALPLVISIVIGCIALGVGVYFTIFKELRSP